MIPAISNAIETRLAAALDPTVTDIRGDTPLAREFTLLSAHSDEARQLGIEADGQDVTVVVTDPTRRLGHIRVEAAGGNCVLFFDNLAWGGTCNANLRLFGDESAMLFNDIDDAYVALGDVFLRSNRQFLFWGVGASGSGCRWSWKARARAW